MPNFIDLVPNFMSQFTVICSPLGGPWSCDTFALRERERERERKRYGLSVSQDEV